MEYAKSKKTALKYFKNRKIKGAKVLKVTPSKNGSTVYFVKTRR